MMTGNPEERALQIADELTELVNNILDQAIQRSTAAVTMDILLSTAISAFFPKLRQFGGATLLLYMDGEVTEFSIPESSSGSSDQGEAETTIALSNDERKAVKQLASAIVHDPQGFEGISIE